MTLPSPAYIPERGVRLSSTWCRLRLLDIARIIEIQGLPRWRSINATGSDIGSRYRASAGAVVLLLPGAAVMWLPVPARRSFRAPGGQ